MANIAMGTNYAAGLPAIDSQELHILLGTRLSEHVVRTYRRTLPLELILNIDMNVDICSPISYLVENPSRKGRLMDSALNSSSKRDTSSRLPGLQTYSGYNTGYFENKLHKNQLACMNQQSILSEWYTNSINQDIEDGKQAIMARFYRHLMTEGAHPRNSGDNAGLNGGGNQVGSRAAPVLITPDSVDLFMMQMRNVIKQMPRSTPVDNQFGNSDDDMFFFGPSQLESVFMQAEGYNKWTSVGDCNACSMFSDVFDRKPRGFMPIGADCVESYTCNTGGVDYKIYPIIFGKRYKGTQAGLRVTTDSYSTENKQSVIFRTDMDWNIHTFDCRYMGIAWITIREDKPLTISC